MPACMPSSRIPSFLSPRFPRIFDPHQLKTLGEAGSGHATPVRTAEVQHDLKSVPSHWAGFTATIVCNIQSIGPKWFRIGSTTLGSQVQVLL